MPGKRKAWHHARVPGDARFAAFLAAFAATVAPAFHLVDGVVAMHRDGPKGGEILPMGLLFAGRDPFAVDAVIARVIGIRETDNLLVNAARRLKLGTTRLDQIAFPALAPDQLAPISFQHPR